MDAIVYDKVGKEAEKVREALYGIYPQETITDAAIASFDDGADGIPVKALTVGVEPVQDLHGYDSPWPAGGGSNLLDYTTLLQRSGYTNLSMTESNGLVALENVTVGGRFAAFYAKVTSGSTYTIKAQSTSTGDDPYISFSDTEPTSAPVFAGSKRNIVEPWTVTASGSYLIICFELGSDLNTWTVNKIQVVAGSTATDATWTPYSNICPISGYTGAEISNAAVNIWDEEWENGTINQNGAFAPDSSRVRSTHLFPVKPETSYYCHSPNDGGIFFYDRNRAFISTSLLSRNAIFTTPANASYGAFYMATAYGSTYNNNISINYPATDTAYHPYAGNQISVTFPSEAGTVYGGTVTLNPDKTGTLVVNRISQLFDGSFSPAWINSYGTVAQYPSSYLPKGNLKQFYENGYYVGLLLSDKLRNGRDAFFTMVIYSENGTSRIMMVLPANASSIGEWNNYIAQNPFTIVYPMENPVTIPLTSAEVSDILTTLYGPNNIWSSTGNIEKLTYRADLGKYIDSHITTAVANALNA